MALDAQMNPNLLEQIFQEKGWIEPSLAEGAYTIVLIPDAQIMVEYHSQAYADTIQWIADHADTRKYNQDYFIDDLTIAPV